MSKYLSCLAALIGLTIAASASASTANGSMGVSAVVDAACVATAAPLNFGNYAGVQLDQVSEVTVNCTNGTPYSVALGSTSAQRVMTGPNNETLGYAIYTDAGHSAAWGTGANVVNGVGNGGPQTIQAYGRIARAQAPAAGLYQDTVVVTLTY
jgi:spore coat protein U-like protein